MSKIKKFVPVNSYGIDINTLSWFRDDIKAYSTMLGYADVISIAFNHDKKAVMDAIKSVETAVNADVAAGIVPESAKDSEIAERTARFNKSVEALEKERDGLKAAFVPNFEASEKLRRTVALLCDSDAELADMIGILKDAFGISEQKARDLVFDLFGTRKASVKDRRGLSIRHEKDRDGNSIERREYHSGTYGKTSGTKKTVLEKLLIIGCQCWLNANKDKTLFDYEVFDTLNTLKSLRAYLETDTNEEQ